MYSHFSLNLWVGIGMQIWDAVCQPQRSDWYGSKSPKGTHGKVTRSRSCVLGRFMGGVGRGFTFTINRMQKDWNKAYINRIEVNEEGK